MRKRAILLVALGVIALLLLIAGTVHSHTTCPKGCNPIYLDGELIACACPCNSGLSMLTLAGECECTERNASSAESTSRHIFFSGNTAARSAHSKRVALSSAS